MFWPHFIKILQFYIPLNLFEQPLVVLAVKRPLAVCKKEKVAKSYIYIY